ncbi:hypothetical protein; putative exported protein [Marinobacter nauticus ATCC 49840]|nr:hypothetical protein; putative exported protein [Marinobacter nauticus ATCC 49840]
MTHSMQPPASRISAMLRVAVATSASRFGSISVAGWGVSGVLGIDQVFRLTVAFGFLLSM